MENFGTPPHRRHRTDDPDTSRIAAEECDSAKREMEVYDAIRSFGENGCISDDLMHLFGFDDQREKKIPYSGITGCYIALERKFYIERRGDKRRGYRFDRLQEVMRAVPDDERARRQSIRDTQLKALATPDAIKLLGDWWNANEALSKAKAVEQLARDQVIGLMFAGVGIGNFALPLDAKYELVATIRSKWSRLEIGEMSKRKVRKIHEDRLSNDLQSDNGFNDDTDAR